MSKKFYIELNEAIPAIEYSDVQPTNMVEVTDTDKLTELYNNLYLQRERDGHDYYATFRSHLMIDIERGLTSSTDAFLLEQHVKDLKDEFISGNWLTAQYVNANLTLSGLFDQAMKDQVALDIANYISENY
jgi:hypothetical protein